MNEGDTICQDMQSEGCKRQNSAFDITPEGEEKLKIRIRATQWDTNRQKTPSENRGCVGRLQWREGQSAFPEHHDLPTISC